MNYLEAEDDTNGSVPMEVGAMKGSGKKSAKGKKGYGKGKYGKSFGKYDKSNEYSKNNEYGEGSEKVKEKGKKGEGKGQGRDERPAPNSSFQGYCRSRGKWEHKASECWQGNVSELFREFSGAECSDHTCGCENGSGYFNRLVMRMSQGGSSAWSVGTYDLWDELVLEWVSVDGMSVCMVFGHQCE